jgi:hypothetical protein
VSRFGYRPVLVTNTLLLGLCIWSFARLGPDVSTFELVCRMFVFGAINSLQFTAMNTITLADLPSASAGSGNALLSVVMQLSMSLGVASAGALLLELAPSGLATGPAVLVAFHRTFGCIGVLGGLAAIIFLQLRPEDGAGLRPVPTPLEG